MPTYDYKCDACEHEWELFQKITDDPIKKCPGCGKRKARRLFGTGAAVMFKGSGFYQTDYRSESYKKAAAADPEHKGNQDSSAAKSEASTPSSRTSQTESAKGKSDSAAKSS